MTSKDIGSKQLTHHYIIAIILLITLIAGLLRLYKVGEHSLWFDEAASVNDVRRILSLPPHEESGMFNFTLHERMPPLYFLLLVPFYLLSQSEWTLRLLSVIAGILSIPLMYCLGTKIFNKSVGLVGALLLAFSPFHLYYSQELRPYSLFLLFSLLAFYISYLALEEDKVTYYLGMIAIFVLGIYTHLYMIFPLILLDLYFVLGWKTNLPHLRKWLLAHLMIAILCIPEFYLVLYHATRGNINLVDYPPGIRSIAGTLYLFTFGRVFFPIKQNLILLLVGATILGGLLLIGIWRIWKERTNQQGRQSFQLFLAAAILYAVIWAVSMVIIPLFDEARVNYLIFLLPFFYLAIAKGWDDLSNPALKSAVVLLAIVISLASIYPYFFEWDQVGKGDFRAAAGYVQRNLVKDDFIYHTTNTSTLPFGYYLDWQSPQIDLSLSDELTMNNKDRLWLVVFKQQGGASYSLSLLGQQGDSLKLQNDLGSVCTDAFSDPNYDLADFKTFPGKNDITVCLNVRNDY